MYKESYLAACRDRGLLRNDVLKENTVREALISQCPEHLRKLSVVILLFCRKHWSYGIISKAIYVKISDTDSDN